MRKGGWRKRGNIRENFRSPDEDWQGPKLNGEVGMDVGNLGGKFSMAEKWYNSVIFTALLLEPGILCDKSINLINTYCLKGREEGSSVPP